MTKRPVAVFASAALATAALAFGGAANAASGPSTITRAVEPRTWCADCSVSSLTATASGPVAVRNLFSEYVADDVSGAAQGDATNPEAIALDTAGNSWIGDSPSTLTDLGTGERVTKGVYRIAEYAKGAALGAKPIRTISGSSTGSAQGFSAIAVAPNGDILTAADNPTSVRVFAPTASGNTAPDQVLQLGLDAASASVTITTDASSTVYIGTPGQIRVFPLNANGKYDASPARVIMTGAAATPSVAVAADGRVYAASGGRTVSIYSATATGTAAPDYALALAADTRPDAVIDTLGADQIALGPDGTLYVSSTSGGVLTEWSAFKNVIPTATTRVAVKGAWGAVTLPASSAAGRAGATFSAPAGGGWFSGTARFVLTSPGKKTITVSANNKGGSAPYAGRYQVALPKLAKGAWTLRVSYGGNANYLPTTLAGKRFTVR